MKDFWNERYAATDYVYGDEPNVFFKHQLDLLMPGKILLPAEGEGRNAVYAASMGWHVTACDFSEEGQKKAEKLALSKGVTIDYRLAEFGELIIAPEYFDCIGLVFAHFTTDTRALYHKRIIRALKPGGTIILEAFAKKQLGKPSGGPKNLDTLFSEEELRKEFASLSFLDITNAEVVLQEGEFHRGPASVIRLVGKK